MSVDVSGNVNKPASGEPTFHWYILHVYSTFEKKVAEDILHSAQKANLADYFNEVVVPVENVLEIKKGKKINTEK